jgi:hypothetical protein
MTHVLTMPPEVARHMPRYSSRKGQLSFPFAWRAEDHVEYADKHMVVRRDQWGPITVHRNSLHAVWVVSKTLPITGPSGRIGAAMWYVFPNLFFRGRDAHNFAHGGRLKNGMTIATAAPFIDCTLQ